MGFDFNKVLNTDIDNTYIDNISWNLRLDNLFYTLCKSKRLKLYGAEITKDKNDSIKIKYIDTGKNFEFILQLENKGQNQLIPYIEFKNFLGERTEEDIAENICNFLTNLFKVIKEYGLIHINRIFIKPEIAADQIKFFTIFNLLFNHLYNNLNLDIFINTDSNFDYINDGILTIDEEVDISYETYKIIIEKIQHINISTDNLYIKNFQLNEKSITDIKKLEDWLIFLQNTNIYENINTNRVSNILFNVFDKNTIQYFIKKASQNAYYIGYNPWFYYNTYLQDYYKNHDNNDIITAFTGVIYAFIKGYNISFIIKDMEDNYKIQLLKEVNNIILDDIKNKGVIFQNILNYYKKEFLN